MDLKSYLCLFVAVLAVENSLACCPRTELERLRGPLTRRLLAGPCVDLKTAIKEAIQESCISKEYESKIMETVLGFKCSAPYYNQVPQYCQQHILPMPMPVAPINPYWPHNCLPGCQSCQPTTTTTSPVTDKPTTSPTTISPPTPKPCVPGYPCQCGSMGPYCNCNQQQENMYEKILMLFTGKQPQYPAQYPQYPNCNCPPNQCNCRPANNCGC